MIPFYIVQCSGIAESRFGVFCMCNMYTNVPCQWQVVMRTIMVKCRLNADCVNVAVMRSCGNDM